MDNLTGRRAFLLSSGLAAFIAPAAIRASEPPSPLQQAVSLSSIDELRMVSRQSTGLVYVAGYYGPSTPGGGGFYWDDNCVDDDDAGFFFKPTDVHVSSPGRWVRSTDRSSLNPFIFGAKGDGFFDDSRAVRNMLLFANKQKKTSVISFSPGTYNLATWELFHSAVELHIFGSGAILLGNGSSFIAQSCNLICTNLSFSGFNSIFQVRALFAYLDFFTLDMLSVKNSGNLLFWQEGAAETGVARLTITKCSGDSLFNRFIFFQASKFEACLIDACNVRNVRNHGVLIGSNAAAFSKSRRNVTITNNSFYDIRSAGDGIKGDESASLEDPFVSGSPETQAFLIYSHRAYITGNIIDGVAQSAGDSEGIYTKCLFVTIIGNTFINAGGSPDGFLAIKDYQGESSDIDSKLQDYNVIIDSNTFVSQLDVGCRAISCQRSNVRISNNKFKGSFSKHNYVVRLYGLLKNISISGNEFLLKDFPDGGKNIGCVRATDSVESLIFSNNILENWSQSGLVVEGPEVSWLSIVNNHFRDCGGRETKSRALHLVNKRLISCVIIEGNMIKRLRRGFSLSLSNQGLGKKLIIKNNIFDDVSDKAHQIPECKNFHASIIADNVLDS